VAYYRQQLSLTFVLEVFVA